MNIDRPRWMASAACAGLDAVTRYRIFFPTRGRLCDQARAYCAVCPVASECLEYAIASDGVAGVWGGTSERQRMDIRRARGMSVRGRRPTIDPADMHRARLEVVS